MQGGQGQTWDSPHWGQQQKEEAPPKGREMGRGEGLDARAEGGCRRRSDRGISAAERAGRPGRTMALMTGSCGSSRKKSSVVQGQSPPCRSIEVTRASPF